MNRQRAQHFTLDPDTVFLNHGSFGACPRVVLDAQRAWRDRMERQPVQFFARDLEPLLDAARAELAAFLHADASGLAFVPNATAAVNAVVGSLALGAGDELLTTNHDYNACHNVLVRAAERSGARVVTCALPEPLTRDGVVDAVIAAVTPRTKLCLLDHVTSPTAAVLPVERIVPVLEARGVPVLVDGAHAPGMLALDLGALGASYYTGNLHKWVCAPKGAGFLAVRADRRATVHPAITSHGANAVRTDRARFLLEFDWTGTADPTAYLTVPAALAFLRDVLPGGIDAVREHNRALALEMGRVLCAALADSLGAQATCEDAMVGAMRAIVLPRGSNAEVLQAALVRARIEVPVFARGGDVVVRVSAQIYNDVDDALRLARAIEGAHGRAPT